MNDLIKQTQELMNSAENFHNQLIKAYNLSENSFPIGAFGMSHNSVMLTNELLNYYYQSWEKRPSPKSDNEKEEILTENTEKIIEVTKSLFISCMSSIEYNAKEYAKQDARFNFRGRIYLKEIMKQSLDLGLISQADYDIWEKIIFIRNSTVHNNAIYEKEDVLTIPSLTLEMHANQSLEGPTNSYLALTEWILNAFNDWCKAVI